MDFQNFLEESPIDESTIEGTAIFDRKFREDLEGETQTGSSLQSENIKGEYSLWDPVDQLPRSKQCTIPATAKYRLTIMARFPIFTVPENITTLIIELLSSWEKAKLALTSIKTAKLIKKKDYKFERLLVQLSKSQHGVQIITYDRKKIGFFLNPIELAINPADIQKWIKSDYGRNSLEMVTKNPAQDTVDVARRLQFTFKIKDTVMAVRLPDLEQKELISLLSNALNVDYDNVTFIADSMSATTSMYLMENLRLDCSLHVRSTLPEDFKHENALKFRSVVYEDASWVTLEMLKSIRNIESVKLHNMKLTCKDINQFLYYWITCEEMMVNTIDLHLPKNQKIQEEILLVGIAAIPTQFSNRFLINPRNKRNNEPSTVGQLTIGKSAVFFKTTLSSIDVDDLRMDNLKV